MYTIFCDDYLLHSDVADYQLLDVLLTMEVNTAGSLRFLILPTHPNASVLAKLKPEIVVKKSGSTIWKGRIVDDVLNLDQTRSIYCEGKLKVLEDTYIRPAIYDGAAGAVLASYLARHNAQCTDVQKIQAGTINVTGDIYRALENYETSLSRILDLVGSKGGYLSFRYEEDGDYLDWVSDFTAQASQEIALGENILDLSRELSAEELYTACIPLGAKLEDENGAETSERLTVESIKGVDYIIDEDAAEVYGLIYAPVAETTWDEVTQAPTLLAQAQEYLDSHKGLVLTLAITALDLAYTGASIDSFGFCEYIKVTSEVHNLLDEYLLTKLELAITNPANTVITLGQSVRTLTDVNKKNQEKVTLTINDLATALTTQGISLGEEIAGRERYIRFAGGIIEMGESGSDIKTQQSNSEYAFLESVDGVVSKPLYLSNPTGNPGDAVVYAENLRCLINLFFNDFAYAPRDNGNVSLVWKG
jgi:hypothetical protein